MLHRLRNFVVLLAAAAAVAAVAFPAAAQYPARQVRMILPLPAASATDTVARVIAQSMSQGFGQTVLVDNKPGADGAIAAAEVMRATPDGYTLFFATNSPLAAVPAMRKTPPYDPVADFTPIGLIGRYLHAVLVHPDVPAKTLPEFFAYARANPGKLNYGSGATFQLIATVNLMKIAGIDLVHVPYKGDPAALIDLIAGRVQFLVATQSTSLPFVKEGKLRVLAITNSARSEAWPDVPTLTESGIKTFPSLSWAALVGPAKMPANLVDRVNRELNATLVKPDVRERLGRAAFESATSSPDELRAFIKDQQELWGRTVRELGLQVD